jgi:hypothetical protein
MLALLASPNAPQIIRVVNEGKQRAGRFRGPALRHLLWGLAMAADDPANPPAIATVEAVAGNPNATEAAAAAELDVLHQRLAREGGAEYCTTCRRGNGVRCANKPDGRGRQHSNQNRTHLFFPFFPYLLELPGSSM